MDKHCNHICYFDPKLLNSEPEPDCPKCGKPCYFSSPILYQNRYWHRKCFVCSRCGYNLRHRNFVEANATNFECSQCLNQIQRKLYKLDLQRCYLCNRPVHKRPKTGKKYFHHSYNHLCHGYLKSCFCFPNPSNHCTRINLQQNYSWPNFRPTCDSFPRKNFLTPCKANLESTCFSKAEAKLKKCNQFLKNDSFGIDKGAIIQQQPPTNKKLIKQNTSTLHYTRVDDNVESKRKQNESGNSKFSATTLLPNSHEKDTQAQISRNVLQETPTSKLSFHQYLSDFSDFGPATSSSSSSSFSALPSTEESNLKIHQFEAEQKQNKKN